MKKVVFYAFQGEEMCFMHLLFNAIDMHKKGIETKIVIEGKATALIKTMVESDNKLYKEVVGLGLIDAVCQACAHQMGVLEFVKNETDLPINADLLGHPPMAPYIKEGYDIITL
ncbi:cytoplasmic protein [Anaerosphaera multitolerans]|uniref:Cytoplasmic protein n=1 Tax=Anaerosphaera multitolerans TaxID=2487351 RepID=A0A437S4L5_9FIRM|nr:cytoplasmic protein [Anaerosphaera multitolerans]RVU53949.1 cytoplasmic protein [Anaerosphaera multitolerans]